MVRSKIILIKSNDHHAPYKMFCKTIAMVYCRNMTALDVIYKLTTGSEKFMLLMP